MDLKQARLILLLIFCAGLFNAALCWGADDDIEKKIEQTKKKLTQTKIREKSVLGNLVKTQKELDRITNNVNQLSARLGTTERKMSHINNQLNNAQHQLEFLESQLSGRKQVLDHRLIAIYKYGYHSYLESLFAAKNFGDFIYRFDMVGNFVKSDIVLINTLKQQQQEAAEKRLEIAKKHQELEIQKNVYTRLHNQTKEQQGRQLSLFKNTQKELADIQNDRVLLEKALDEMENTSKQMESQIRSYQNKNRNAAGTGSFIWPVHARITSYFGYRVHPILRKRKYHSGLDLAAPYGTEISAADSGVVIFSGVNGGYGKMISIDHGGELSTVYGHCSVLLVGRGDTVHKGEVIAKVGSTGLSTGPHLHFEVRKDGTPVDPLQYL